jgi:hypothetical protein
LEGSPVLEMNKAGQPESRTDSGKSIVTDDEYRTVGVVI